MKTTIESSAQLTAAIQRCMPSGQQTVLNSLLDELEAYRAAPVAPGPDLVKALRLLEGAQAKALLATKSHSRQVRDGIRVAIAAYRVQLDVLTHRNRTSFLMARLEAKYAKYGLAQVPDRETVKEEIDGTYEINADSL